VIDLNLCFLETNFELVLLAYQKMTNNALVATYFVYLSTGFVPYAVADGNT
jgi:hypothetical protein